MVRGGARLAGASSNRGCRVGAAAVLVRRASAFILKSAQVGGLSPHVPTERVTRRVGAASATVGGLERRRRRRRPRRRRERRQRVGDGAGPRKRGGGEGGRAGEGPPRLGPGGSRCSWRRSKALKEGGRRDAPRGKAEGADDRADGRRVATRQRGSISFCALQHLEIACRASRCKNAAKFDAGPKGASGVLWSARSWGDRENVHVCCASSQSSTSITIVARAA